MTNISRAVGSVVLACLFASALLQTGCGGATCGDGQAEGGEACDDGNLNDYDGCTGNCETSIATEVQIVWTLIGTEFVGFTESCVGVEAQKVRLEFTGPEPRTVEVDCTFGRTMVRGLAPGAWTVSASLWNMDVNTAALTPVGDAVTTSFTVELGPNPDVAVDFPYATFTRPLRGTFFYRITWDGAETCTGPNPDVATYALRIERDGVALSGVRRAAQMEDQPVELDGESFWTCRDFTAEFPEFVSEVPWGPATAVLTGRDSGGTLRFQQEFDVFVGAGRANPELTFDVAPSL